MCRYVKCILMVWGIWFAGCTTQLATIPTKPTPPAQTATSTAVLTTKTVEATAVEATAVITERNTALPVVQPLIPQTIQVKTLGLKGAARIEVVDGSSTIIEEHDVVFDAPVIDITIVPKGHIGVASINIIQGNQVYSSTQQIYDLAPKSIIDTDVVLYNDIFSKTVSYINCSKLSYALSDEVVTGYRSPDSPLLWLRDHVYQGTGFKYIEPQVFSLLDEFGHKQFIDGSFPDWLDEPQLYVVAQRSPVESDLEFLYVIGVYEAWQMSGDDQWMYSKLPIMRGGISYLTSDVMRWNKELGLVRRPYTIDMWDFSYGDTTTNPENGLPSPRHWIDNQTIWGIFHGDNTGLVYALRLLARMEQHAGNEYAAQRYKQRADALLQRLMAISWNGQFFRHFVPEDPSWRAANVDMNTQLSISNAYALNRDVLSFEQAQAIIDAYVHRTHTHMLYPWFSIDPPFPAYSFGMAGRKGELPGEYVNGGMMPLVGGELARGAFRYQRPDVGFQVLKDYAALTEMHDGSYLWYYPDGQPGISGPDTINCDGWGASAMLGALMEGAAGIHDVDTAFTDVILQPQWMYSDVDNANVVARYPASKGYVAYQWHRTPHTQTLTFTGSAQKFDVWLPIADERVILSIEVDGITATPQTTKIEHQQYVHIPASSLLPSVFMHQIHVRYD